jgi:hypothetical protein
MVNSGDWGGLLANNAEQCEFNELIASNLYQRAHESDRSDKLRNSPKTQGRRAACGRVRCHNDVRSAR